MRRLLSGLVVLLFSLLLQAQTPTLPNPILFVTQLPIATEWMTIGQTFGNHIGDVNNCGRGGDLWIRYSDGTLRNLTAEAGYGTSGFQGGNSIAVRNPRVHWDGQKALFSMVVGATEQQYQHETYYWQIYEISGLAAGETPVISLVANQPQNYNNIHPFYGSDDRILFISDRPHNGEAHLYPQLDEYESARTATGIWSLDPLSGDLFLLNHTPSGAFYPFLDSFGRVIYTRWDHLQRDQQNEGGGNGAFNWSSEDLFGTPTSSNSEIFPELRTNSGNIYGHRFELFLPWQINQDGSDEEIVNHIGRHELSNYFTQSFMDDPNLVEFFGSGYNPNRIQNLFQIAESQTQPGLYIGVDSPTFYHYSAGRLVALHGEPLLNPDSMTVDYLTPGGFSDGHYRNPLPLSNGTLLASHTAYSGVVGNLGTTEFPRSPFRFRLKTLQNNGGSYSPALPLTTGIRKPVSFWNPDIMISYADTVDMWELDAAEVVARPRPQIAHKPLEAPEMQIFNEENIDLQQLRDYMKQNELALIVSRNVTTRDKADRQQPFNLRVANGSAETIATGGRVYDLSYMQLFQADLIRGYQNYPTFGRRTLPVPMHADGGSNIEFPGAPPGAVEIEQDGSVAAFVPARRALSWQTSDSAGTAVVRERYWVTFQPGEIRVCAGCHGSNTVDQAGNPPAGNPPEALRQLMQHYKTLVAINPADPLTLPATPQLLGNYPNPFNPATTIRYALPQTGEIHLSIYNLLGQEVVTLFSGKQEAGVHTLHWDAASQASGIYLVNLEAAGRQQSRKIVLLK